MSSSFATPLQLEALDAESVRGHDSERALYRLLSDLVYHSELFGIVTAPQGLLTDFASIPKAALWFINDDDPRILFASVIHDYIYTNRGKLAEGVEMSREQADALLREAMLACGASGFIAGVVYRAVRLGGGGHWK